MILLTGANGFLGRQIYRALKRRGQDVRVVLRHGTRIDGDPPTNILYTTDLFSETPDWWRQALDTVDTVIHAAWYAEPGKCLNSEKNVACLTGTLNLAQACLTAGVRRFVGIGTCFEYDLSVGLLPVETPLRPTSLYGASKASTYLTLSAWFADKKVSFAWCRPFYLYGEGEDSRRLVPYLHDKLSSSQVAELTGGSQIRDYMDVKDAGDLIVQVALSEQKGPVNICSGKGTTVRELAEGIADQYGRRDLLRFGIRSENAVDPPKVVGILNIQETNP